MTDHLAGTAPRRLSDLSLALLGVGLLTGARVALLFLSDLELHGDEAQYWSWAQEPAFGYYSKPPLIAWIIAATTAACGDGAPCVRLAAPLLHGATALVLYRVAADRYDGRTGLLAALAYATLPAVSFSSGLISTDVPLLFFWALALFAYGRLLGGGGVGWALGLGLALGLGALAKYAMLYFLFCAAVHAAVDPTARRLLLGPRAALAVAVLALSLMPNVAWNAATGWATVGHTAENANWGGDLFRPDKGLEFLASQLGVFGPILFAALAWRALRAVRRPVDPAERLLLTFTLPVLLVVTLQAFLSRAHANWAAVAYVAATPLAVAWLRAERPRWLAASFVLHLAAAAVLCAAVLAAPLLTRQLGRDPFARLHGWQRLADGVAAAAAANAARVVLADDRMTTASLLHGLRGRALEVRIWDRDGRPDNHYELTRPFAGAEAPVLLVVEAPRPSGILERFARVDALGSVARPDWKRGLVRYHLFLLDGYRGGAR